MKSIIIVGLGKDFCDFFSKRFPFGCFDIVCATDFKYQNAKNANLINANYIEIEDAIKESFDYIIISDKKEYNLYAEWIKKNSPEQSEKILSQDELKGFAVDESYQYHEFSFSFGELNPDKIFYIIRPTIAIGLAACIGRTLAEYAYAKDRGWIPIVDMQNYPNMYLSKEKLYKVNAWEYFFNQISNYSLAEVYSSKHVVFGDVRKARSQKEWSEGNVKHKNKLWNEVLSNNISEIVKEELNKETQRLFKNKQNKKIAGVLIRGTDYVSLQPDNHPIQPSTAEMIKIITEKKEQWGYDYIFLSTEDMTILKSFQKLYGTKLLYTNQKRYENTGNQYLASIKNNREDDEIKRGIEYLVTMILLSRCNYLAASKCGAMHVVQMMNGDKYQDKIIVDKGIYTPKNKVITVLDCKSIVLVGESKEKENVIKKISEKYHKPIYVLCEISTNPKEISDFRQVEKPFSVIIDDKIKNIHDTAVKLQSMNQAFTYKNFLLKNEVDVAILKAMNKTEYIDENNNEIIVHSDISEKIKITYRHQAMNSIIKMDKIRVTESLKINVLGNAASISIGENTSIYEAIIDVTTSGKVYIGKECLISYRVGFYQNDRHQIFDLQTGNRINQNKNIKIGSHVWIERDVMLLGGVSIPDNCVIGSRTITSGKFDKKNAIIAGQPGKVIRENIIWARDEQIRDYDNYEFCEDKAGLKYLND